ncbi:hypothetical protein CK203_097455 [Vitis vinifera]|uniref:Uncharacterized protein n=1 Tax=Vitis vinifera TaxID=29760 RepID=A0A438BTS2_VITVI|nr:hypothetical protein CK203_097455 [Vitis vinifera]
MPPWKWLKQARKGMWHSKDYLHTTYPSKISPYPHYPPRMKSCYAQGPYPSLLLSKTRHHIPSSLFECGGLFCNSCTQQRMVLRGQGDSPVRICDPCKNLEEAARFEMRHGHKNKSGKGTGEDGWIIELGADRSKGEARNSMYQKTALLQGKRLQVCDYYMLWGMLAPFGADYFITGSLDYTGVEGCSSRLTSKHEDEVLNQILGKDGKESFSSGRESTSDTVSSIERSLTVNEPNHVPGEMGSISPEELRQQALDEKGKYKILKGEGKSEEALKAFKRGKELERQAGALEISLRKSRKETHGIDKSEVIALKKKALMLKREGKLIEAKEELKRAKLLEKQLEEQEFLAEAEDSDDEISSLIRSIDNDKQGDFSIGYNPANDFDFDHLVGMADDIGLDGNFEAMDEDMDDPEMAAALESLGWSEDSHHPVDIVAQSAPIDRDTLLHEIQSLKREALNEKRAGNTSVAMVLLKKAKVLERDLDGFDSQGDNSSANDPAMFQKGSTSQTADNSLMLNKADNKNVNGMKIVEPKMAPKSKLMIQKELLGLKKKALALRREGRLDEAEEELKKGKVLEQQLEEMDNASKVKFTQVDVSSKHPDISGTLDLGDVGEEGDVTDQD